MTLTPEQAQELATATLARNVPEHRLETAWLDRACDLARYVLSLPPMVSPMADTSERRTLQKRNFAITGSSVHGPGFPASFLIRTDSRSRTH